MSTLGVSHVRLATASPNDRDRGLLGYVSLVLNSQLRLDGVTLRRTSTGRLSLSYPERRDRRGGSHPYVQPLTDAAREHVERQVFAALGLDKAGSSP